MLQEGNKSKDLARSIDRERKRERERERRGGGGAGGGPRKPIFLGGRIEIKSNF